MYTSANFDAGNKSINVPLIESDSIKKCLSFGCYYNDTFKGSLTDQHISMLVEINKPINIKLDEFGMLERLDVEKLEKNSIIQSNEAKYLLQEIQKLKARLGK
jgi:hypothetical protein